MKFLSLISNYLNASSSRCSLAICLTLLCCSFFSCSNRGAYSDPKLTRVTIVDRNGLKEVVGTKDRLNRYATTDFECPQPYQKVIRLFSRDQEGNNQVIMTSYHPNGQLCQYLEGQNNRAHGPYKEWFPDGVKKVEAYVIGGTADLEEPSSWIFDGLSQAWDEENNLVAEVTYCKGRLHGTATYYHPNGQVWKCIPYENGQINGTYRVFLKDGQLLQSTEFRHGAKHGNAIRLWKADNIAFEEHHKEGKLLSGTYYDIEGQKVAEISGGNGFRALFGKNQVIELQEFREGKQKGLVKEFNKERQLHRSYHVKDGQNHGEETLYTQRKEGPQAHLLVSWHEGVIQGEAKTWYANGTLESLREMSENCKHGLSTAWYEDGSLMLIEEYEKDRLVRGEYHQRGERAPLSQVIAGSGVATLFSPKGSFLRKITYKDGRPLE